MSELITSCPKCSTSFKLSLAHLKTAKGAVRCGSCLQVFKASEHWVTQPSKEEQQKIDQLINPLSQVKIQPADTAKPASEAKPNSSTPKSSAPTPTTSTSDTNTDEDQDDDFMISDDMDGAADGEGSDLELSTDFMSATGSKRKGGNFNTDVIDTATESDENWALNLLNDDDDEDEKDIPSYSAPSESVKALGDTAYDLDYSSLDSIADEFAEEEGGWHSAVENAYQEDEEEDYEEESDNTKHSLLDSIRPDTLSFNHGKKRRGGRKQGLWALLSLSATLCLAIQLAVWNFGDWSRQPQWRSFYQTACATLGCKLPMRLNPKQIRSHSLIIRSHPEYKHALVVDTILVNMADFAQPYPGLLLEFSDKKDRVVASRRFTAREYLSGELSGSQQMPSKQPIHLSLEIKDPGKNATNWQLKITL